MKFFLFNYAGAAIKLSLVLATVGRTDDFDRLIASLLVQDSLDFELIVVDQNPDNRLVSRVDEARTKGVDVRHVRMARPNLSLARNIGISYAKNEIVAFPDDDCWYECDVVSRVISEFSSGDAPDGLVVNWVEQSDSLAQGSSCTNECTLTWGAWSRFRGGNASSISLFIRKSLLESLNGFDPRLGVGQWYGAAEETDFVLRALKQGARLQRCRDARVHHLFAPSVDRLTRKEAWQIFVRSRGTGALYAKHRLSMWVIFRGIFSPPIRLFLGGQGVVGLVRGFLISAGRVQGALWWAFEKG